jgi:hypothetical protein
LRGTATKKKKREKEGKRGGKVREGISREKEKKTKNGMQMKKEMKIQTKTGEKKFKVKK